MYNIQLTTRDGQHLTFGCGPAQNLIAAAQAAGIILPSQCQRGSCGACTARVTSGDYVPGAHNPEMLACNVPGEILMCCTVPRSDLSIVLPYDRSRILFHQVRWRNAEIAALESVAVNTLRLELRLIPDGDDNCAAEFEPGQFMELEIPGSDERRAYSLANTPNWEGALEFLIRLQPHGRFSAFLRDQARPNVRLMLRGPLGSFGIREGSLLPRWFVAGGTGLAPVLSMLRRMAEMQEMLETRLFFGVNQESELFALDELWRLGNELPHLQAEICVWRPRPDWHGFAGTPAEALQKALGGSEVLPEVYLCGPAPLISAATKVAEAAGVPPEQIFNERFVPA